MGIRSFRSRALGLFAGAALPLLGVLPVHAADQLDQSQPFFSGQQAFRTPMAQTFTAGGSGAVDRVSLMLTTSTGATAITVQIQTVSGGKPSGTVLGTSSLTGSVPCCHQWRDFVFNPAVSVASGTQYAIVVRPTGNLTWYANFGHDDYGAGQLWLSSGSSWIGGASFGYDFCFQTYLTSGATNHPPTVTANATTVNGSEGSPVSTGGTFSDPDGDTVSLTASTGTITKTGGSSGTWAWAIAAPEEAPAHTVTITAADGHGATASTSFTFTVAAVAPTVNITGAPASSPEGTAVTLTGTATSPSAADNAAGFTYTWTVTKDGAAFASGSGSSITFTPNDEGAFVATLQAVDDGGATGSASVTVTGTNVAPTSSIAGITHDTLVLVAGQTVTFTGGFTDPSSLDTHTATLDWGDGTKETYTIAAGAGSDTTDTHTYAAAGTYTLTYSVADDDGGASSVSAKITVESAAQALSVIDAYVGGLSSLNGNGLSAKLEAAMASAGRGDTNTTCNQLDAFLNQLVALSNSGRLSASDGSTLGSSAWAVHRALGCTKVKVAWLNLTV
ncbi:MAG TPA: PKD domain-containing protein [Candidatus Dormibacteraeota bacterium]|nr:PKD domain-containing protein [Candidatus Dormibacteraeota bacterium]